MYFNSDKIKLSFSRAKYHTDGNVVYCTLQYTVRVPWATSTPKDNGVGLDTFLNLGVYSAVGKATCNGSDVFDKQLGRDISNARAEAKAYKQAKLLVNKYVKEVAKTYYNMSLEFEERADYIQRHDAEYIAELSK